MSNYNLNTVGSNLNSYQVQFKGKDSSSTSNPVNEEIQAASQGLASKEYSDATKAVAIAQVLTGNNLKYSTTPQEYMDSLIKQGKIRNKHFYATLYGSKDNGTSTSVIELNSEGEQVKETIFCRDNKYSGSWNAQYFYNPKYSCPYKEIYYKKDGSIDMSNINIVEEKATDAYGYRPNGSLEYYSDFKDGKGTKYSEDGKETTFSFKDENGNTSEQKYREYQDFNY